MWLEVCRWPENMTALNVKRYIFVYVIIFFSINASFRIEPHPEISLVNELLTL